MYELSRSFGDLKRESLSIAFLFSPASCARQSSGHVCGAGGVSLSPGFGSGAPSAMVGAFAAGLAAGPFPPSPAAGAAGAPPFPGSPDAGAPPSPGFGEPLAPLSGGGPPRAEPLGGGAEPMPTPGSPVPEPHHHSSPELRVSHCRLPHRFGSSSSSPDVAAASFGSFVICSGVMLINATICCPTNCLPSAMCGVALAVWTIREIIGPTQLMDDPAQREPLLTRISFAGQEALEAPRDLL